MSKRDETQAQAHRPGSLTEFLLARIAEDEVQAPRIHDADCAWLDEIRFWGPEPGGEKQPGGCGRPLRVLAECEAKRQMVEDYEILLADYRTTHAPETEARRFQALIACARAAAVYADHPEYQEDWRP